MRLNAVLVQKALNSLSSAVYYMAQAIEPDAEDFAGYNALLKAKQSLSDAQKAAQVQKPRDKASKEADKALADDLAREEKAARKPAQEPERRQDSGLPDKLMKQATMEEFLKGWTAKTKAKEVKTAGAFAPGMGCSFQGVEHSVKAVFNNGVALLLRKGTQYHRLASVDQLDALFLKDSGAKGSYAPGQKVEVGFGMRDAAVASSFRPASVVSIHGQSAQIKYLDTGMTSTAKLSHLRPSRV